jgi:hypothetical protein
MNLERTLLAGLACLIAASAWAQTPPSKPLNLELPPQDLLPSGGRTAAAPAHATSAAHASTSTDTIRTGAQEHTASQPGVYYGDTSGQVGPSTASDDTPHCDDASYNQPQVHGSVGAGVMAGNHVDGSYQSGRVNITRAFGSCDHPTGGVSISIGVSQGHFDGPHGHR